MSIYTDYISFRTAFSVTGVVTTDGMPRFDGFDHTFRPFTNWEFAAVAGITIDMDSTNDTPAWVDRWHWYLSDPGAANGNPRWQIVRADPSALVTRSARVTLSLTAHGVSLFPSQEPGVVSGILRDVHLYAFNIADQEVYWADLHRCAFAPESFTPDTVVTIT